ncbi:MAG TPA: DNA-binding domain-containing protein [Myxococcota bacterium]|nr:DNA-binding domain-containing protein [Myxococcota bacterium]
MSNPHAELGRLQRRLWRLISEPEGVAAALADEQDALGEGLSHLIRGDRGLAPEGRLAVYSNAYFARIHDCLRSDFGALARALGPAAFHDLVKTYLLAHPPSYPSLRYAGKDLAGFLETEPFAAIFARRCAYCADLARLEWALIHAFDAEDAPVLAREALAGVAPEAWASLRFKASPALVVLSLGWPVEAVRKRFDRESDEETWQAPPALEPERTHVRVWRREETVSYRAIPALEAELLRTLLRGEDFGVLCERVAEEVGEGQAAAQAARFLEAWVSAGLLCALA